MTFPGVSQVLHLAVTDSTQTVARFLAEEGAPHGTLVWADAQTGGRGRMKRRWKSAPGGLYFSLILRPRFAPSRLAELSLRTAEAAATSLSRQAGIETLIKPPNDVYAVKNARARKICGILAEASGDSRKTDWVALGVGINVNNAPGLPTATSAKAMTGKTWDLPAVLRSFLLEFQRSYAGL